MHVANINYYLQIDNKTTKTKGYGFVSFSDPQDFLKVLKEMNGKYIGNRPCKIRRSEWKDRSVGESEVKQVTKEMYNKNKKKKK
jgi:RNA recognition motif-containing protein